MSKLLPPPMHVAGLCILSVLSLLLSSSWAWAQQLKPTGTESYIDPPAFAVCRGGTVQAWGGNDHGELGLGAGTIGVPNVRLTPITIPNFYDVVAIDWYADHAVALKQDGSVWTWGNNDRGQLGISSLTTTPVPTRVTGLPCQVVAVEAGYDFTLALLENGSVWAWGNNARGQLGFPNTNPTVTFYTVPQPIPGLASGVTSISASAEHALVLLANGEAKAWGYNTEGEIGANLPNNSSQFTPITVQFPLVNGVVPTIREVQAAVERSVFVTSNGQVFACGQNDQAHIGDGTSLSRSTPVQTLLPAGVQHVALTLSSSLALYANGQTYVWGSSASQLSCSATGIVTTPVPGPTLAGVVQVGGLSLNGLYAVYANNDFKTWGSNATYELGYSPPGGSSCVPTIPTGICAAIPRGLPQATSCCGTTFNFYQNTGATYVAPFGAPFEIGNYNVLTEIDASQAPYNGATVVFDGVYHVKGALSLINGNFELRPGTVFYIEPNTHFAFPPTCYPYVQGYNEYGVRIAVGRKGSLQLRGARLQSTCQEMWGGIYLTADGVLKTSNQAQVQDAYIGVMAGEYCQQNGEQTQYYLTETTFNNCHIGLLDLDRNGVRSGEGVTKSIFTSDPGTMLAPFNQRSATDYYYGRAGLVVGGANLSGLALQDNEFAYLVHGAEVSGGSTLLRANTFRKCFEAAVYVGGMSSGLNYASSVTVRDNTIDIPNDYVSTANQLTASAPVVGVRVNDQNTQFNRIETNTISGGTADPRQDQKLQRGAEIFAYGPTNVNQVNQISNVDEGVYLQDTGSNQFPGVELFVANNVIRNAATSVLLTGDQNTWLFPSLECNTLDNSSLGGTNYGIRFDQNALATDLGNSQYPNGNNFIGVDREVENNSGAPIDYWKFAAEQVSDVTNGPNSNGTVQLADPNAYPCSSPQRGNYTQGVNRTVPPTQAQLLTWRRQLRLRQGTPKQLLQVEAKLLAYYHEASQQDTLETFTATLPLYNLEAFNRLSLYLLNFHYRTNQPTAALRSRTALLAYGGTDAEVRTRVAFADVLHRLQQPQARFTAADSTTLAGIAAANVGFSDVACTTLRYFRPTACGGTTSTSTSNRLPSGLSVTPTPPTRVAYLHAPTPNPAQETVRFAYALPQGQPEGELWLTHVLSGKRVLTQQLVEGEGLATLPVNNLAPGLYACTLVLQGHPLATQKLSVIH